MKRSNLVLVILFASFLLSATLEHFLPPKHLQASAMAHGLVIAVLCYCWCRAESLERHVNPPGRSALWAGLFPLIGVPIYMFRTRSAKRGFIGSGKAFLLLVAMMAGSYGTAELLQALRT